MMRARAAALALVNWKGVFYERYLLDPHVTALEGANGAGKTTVMIAAYIVLLPDMSRLRFTNLGESGATGGDKGIWGRLGEPGRPSYAALDIELPNGKRLLAGVELQRKAEPSVEPTPFVISNLPAAARLQDLLLLSRDGHDQVPELSELKHSAKALGAHVEVFASTKEYLASLFEQGVTPLRLSTDEERNKYNDMLRTSMTGGISRALTVELRSFLLKEESGLSDTLVHMRKNLDACRRTRIEVVEAQRLEHEIAGIFDAGQRMFRAAREATRLHAEELRHAAEGAQQLARAEQQRLVDLARSVLDAESRHVAATEQLKAERVQLERCAAEQVRARRAHELSRKLASYAAELAQKQTERGGAAEQRDRAALVRSHRLQARDQARDAYERSAHGLADVQKGLDELHRSAHAFRRAQATLGEARELLDDPAFVAEQAEQRLALVVQETARIDSEYVRLDREREQIGTRRREYEIAARALEEIAPAAPGEDAPGEDALARARDTLARLSELEHLASRHDSLERELCEARLLAVKQEAVQKHAHALAGGGEGPHGAAWVRARLGAAERDLQAAEERAAALKSTAEQAVRADAQASAELERLQAQARELASHSAILAGIEGRERAAPWTVDQALELQQSLLEQREELRHRIQELEIERERALRRVTELKSSFGNFPAELIELRDELDAELLAARFDEIEPEEAARLQARLGEAAQALVVRDPEQAAADLAGRERQLGSVWLVSPDFVAPEEVSNNSTGDVIVREAHGVRLTRVPPRPTLGRRARARRATELEREAEQFGQELEAAHQRLRRLEASARQLRTLLAKPWPSGPSDPETEAAECDARRQRARALAEQAELERSTASAMIRELGELVAELRSLLGDAYLLDLEDQSARARTLCQALEAARSAKLELVRCAAARATLSSHLDALRSPPSEANEDDASASQQQLQSQRDRCFRAADVLRRLIEQRAALGGQGAEHSLAAHAELVPALQEQHARARSVLEAAEAAVEAAQESWEAATSAWQKVEGEWAALEAYRAQQLSELERESVSDCSEAALAELAERLKAAEAEVERWVRRERELATELALAAERRERLGMTAQAAQETAADAEQRAQPAAAAARELSERLEGLGIGSLLTLGPDELESSTAAWAEAASKRELLLERASAARGGSELVASVQALCSSEQGRQALSYLDAWLLVREWLSKRIPAQIAQGVDPLEGLERLRDYLSALERRLARQEGDLRGASEDISRGIEVQLRRARNQVRRLGQSLDGVRFGSIQAIRVQMTRNERMDQVLRALRDGAAQEFLFQRSLPIEDALNEVFRRYGGGRSGGHRILDYREYVELRVEVKRRASEEWEAASATRLSTGEAIGVGAALMMVVLTEWERDANLLRGRREHGSLRFLFLDEANRLSPDNLGTLFDLCQTLDLQLLIAAPEVARAQGNTTYRLVRTVDETGREEVIVSGRRAAQASAEQQPTPEPQQHTLAFGTTDPS